MSGLAAGTYLAMLIASLFIGPGTPAPDRRLAWGAMLVLVGAAAGSAVWFIIVQKWFIRAFCPYCMAAHITAVLLAVLIVWQASKQLYGDSINVAPNIPAISPNPTAASRELPISTTAAVSAAPIQTVSASDRYLIGKWSAIHLVIVGVVLASILAACQISFVPPAVYTGGESQHNLPAVDPRDVPLVGSPDALYVVTLLFDYRCPHCQNLHSMLDEVIRRYDGKLAFALCPAPLNNQCNPYIARYVEEFKDSCELAKISLAVWVAKREAFAAFDQWMFSPDPRPALASSNPRRSQG